MRISDWSSDVSSSDLAQRPQRHELGDGVVFAVAVLAAELERRGPVIRHAPVYRVGDVQLLVHLPVDSVELRAPIGAGQLVQYLLPVLLIAQGVEAVVFFVAEALHHPAPLDRKSTRLNPVTNAHPVCSLLLEKKTNKTNQTASTTQ